MSLQYRGSPNFPGFFFLLLTRRESSSAAFYFSICRSYCYFIMLCHMICNSNGVHSVVYRRHHSFVNFGSVWFSFTEDSYLPFLTRNFLYVVSATRKVKLANCTSRPPASPTMVEPQSLGISPSGEFNS
ncbi:hypothetical protein F4803DRAFT_261376 [Xylaria telfairii]|nr:hypothetical protein F4803DRAFT_261376 [Xylaria telfairii]